MARLTIFLGGLTLLALALMMYFYNSSSSAKRPGAATPEEALLHDSRFSVCEERSTRESRSPADNQSFQIISTYEWEQSAVVTFTELCSSGRMFGNAYIVRVRDDFHDGPGWHLRFRFANGVASETDLVDKVCKYTYKVSLGSHVGASYTVIYGQSHLPKAARAEVRFGNEQTLGNKISDGFFGLVFFEPATARELRLLGKNNQVLTSVALSN